MFIRLILFNVFACANVDTAVKAGLVFQESGVESFVEYIHDTDMATAECGLYTGEYETVKTLHFFEGKFGLGLHLVEGRAKNGMTIYTFKFGYRV